MVRIEFVWKGEVITQFIEKKHLADDINDKECFWGEFIIGKDVYQYQIWWSGEIAVFEYGATEPCAMLDNFTLVFSKAYNKK